MDEAMRTWGRQVDMNDAIKIVWGGRQDSREDAMIWGGGGGQVGMDEVIIIVRESK